jgi:hypothetical protein
MFTSHQTHLDKALISAYVGRKFIKNEERKEAGGVDGLTYGLKTWTGNGSRFGEIEMYLNCKGPTAKTNVAK